MAGSSEAARIFPTNKMQPMIELATIPCMSPIIMMVRQAMRPSAFGDGATPKYFPVAKAIAPGSLRQARFDVNGADAVPQSSHDAARASLLPLVVVVCEPRGTETALRRPSHAQNRTDRGAATFARRQNSRIHCPNRRHRAEHQTQTDLHRIAGRRIAATDYHAGHGQ